MKAKTRKAKTPRSEYLKGCEEAKRFLPKGCRFLEVGEVVPDGAKSIFSDGEIDDSTWVGSKVFDDLLPIFIPIQRPTNFDALATFRRIMGAKLEDLDRDHADAIVADFIGSHCRKEDFVAYVKAAKKGLL